MPTRPPHPCNQPGCPELVSNGGYCEKHRAAHDKDRLYNERSRDMERQKFESGSYWRRVRHAYLSRNPLCHDCLEAGRVEPARQVHHIDGDYRHNDESNLMGLCHSHHSKRTARGE